MEKCQENTNTGTEAERNDSERVCGDLNSQCPSCFNGFPHS